MRKELNGMDKDRKINLQQSIINDLQEKNNVLTARIQELEQKVRENENIVTAANDCITKYTQIISLMERLKAEYETAIKEVSDCKKHYEKDINHIINTIKNRWDKT